MEALECFDKAIKLAPNNSKAWYNLATLYTMLGEIDKAIQCIDKSIIFDPNYEPAFRLKRLIDTIKIK